MVKRLFIIVLLSSSHYNIVLLNKYHKTNVSRSKIELKMTYPQIKDSVKAEKTCNITSHMESYNEYRLLELKDEIMSLDDNIPSFKKLKEEYKKRLKIE